jgi:AcrR family transcriptional regulator
MRKGEQTRAAIVATAVDLAARDGLEGLTIGGLAERMQMSKSGVFAHFGSREDLQIAVLKEYERRFVEDVLVPSLPERRGLPRLRAIYCRWLERTAIEAARGCVWISGATEYDDRPGAVRDELVAMVQSWQRELSRAIRQAIDTGELRADLDPSELVFEMYGVILVLHHDTRLLNNPQAFERAQRACERQMRAYLAGGRSTADQERPATSTPQCLTGASTDAPIRSATA